MAKGERTRPLHEEQRMIHRATLAGMQADGFSEELIQSLDKLSEELFTAAQLDFVEGEPAEYMNKASSMNTFMEVVNCILREHKLRKKGK